MKVKRMHGWRLRYISLCFVASLFLLTPLSAAADTTTDPSTTPATDSSVVADGSTATQTDQTAAQVGQTISTDPTTDPNPVINQPSTDPTDTSNTTVNNNLDSTAQSGDATVAQNQTGGNATTGNALATTTIINTIQASTDPSAIPLQSFVDTISGTQNGDLTIDPTMLQTFLSTTNPDQITALVNYLNSSTINNNLNLSATSGNATVDSNGVGGNATTGNATTNANLLNLINSAINDQQTFLGIINILGNLNGNIVIPQNLINALATQGAIPSGTTTSQITNNLSINNQISLTAQSGNASVISNGIGGNATSGNATTNLQQYNLINSQIGGGNLLLAFVNVLGVWNGYLFGNPQGTTSALVGSGIQNSIINPTLLGSITNTETINNNLTLTSTTGNALVSNNLVGGNATSGNASSSANIVNILGDQINLSGWFGIIFINVFGSWNGSLVATAPDTPTIVIAQSANIGGAGPSTASYMPLSKKHYQSYGTWTQPQTNSGVPTDFGSAINAHLIGQFLNPFLHSSEKSKDVNHSSPLNMNILALFLIAIAVASLIADRVISRRRA